MIDLFNYKAVAKQEESDVLFLACVDRLIEIMNTPPNDKQQQAINLREARRLEAQIK